MHKKAAIRLSVKTLLDYRLNVLYKLTILTFGLRGQNDECRRNQR